MIGIIIGSGIFRVPSTVAASVEGVGAIGLLWVVAGLLALFGCLAMAELACMYPQAGGVYVFLREAYGPSVAFLYGWTRLLLLVPASIGAIALILAAYLNAFVPVDAVGERWVAAGVIVLVTLLNYRSLLWSALLENVVTATKLLALAALAVAALAFGDRAGGALAQAPSFGPASWAAFGLALVTAMWTYSGWTAVAAMAGEVRAPARTIPRAMLGAIVAVIVVYLLTNAAYLYVLPIDEMAGSSLVAADAATRVFGSWGASLVAAIVVLTTFGAVQAAMMFNPRIFFAMAQDGLLLAPIGGVHREYLTPHLATLFTSLLGIGYVLVRSFEQLAQAFVLGVWPFHVLMIWAVFRLRRTRPDAERPYRAALVQKPGLTLFGFGLILAGIPFYFVARRRMRAASGRTPR
jgi:amino acid transporter